MWTGHGFPGGNAGEDFVGQTDAGGGGGDEGADMGEVDDQRDLFEVDRFARVIWAGQDQSARAGLRGSVAIGRAWSVLTAY